MEELRDGCFEEFEGIVDIQGWESLVDVQKGILRAEATEAFNRRLEKSGWRPIGQLHLKESDIFPEFRSPFHRIRLIQLVERISQKITQLKE